MKKILSIVLCLFMTLAVYGQDARQRTVETIVADVLAQLPAQSGSDFETNFEDLAKSAPRSVEVLASMFKPLSEGKNNLLQYAVAGLVTYASDAECYKEQVNLGLSHAIASCRDLDNKAFFLRQLRYVSSGKNVELMKSCISEPKLSPLALAVLEEVEGGREAILELAQAGKVEKALLARSVATLDLVELEPVLVGWLETGELNEDQHAAVCMTLGSMGTEASLEILKEESLYDYAVLVDRLSHSGNVKAAAKGASYLMKSGVPHLKMHAARIQMEQKGEKGGLKLLKKALKDENRPYRNVVLNDATEMFGVEKVEKVVAKSFSSANDECKTDLVNWIGNHQLTQSADLVLSVLSGQGELAQAAIAAAGKLGTEETVLAVINQLGGENTPAALAALKAVKGLDLEQLAVKAYQETTSILTKEGLLQLASIRKMTLFAPIAFAALSDDKLSAAALQNLSGLVGEGDIEQLGSLLEEAEGEQVALLQNAFSEALRNLSAENRYEMVTGLMAQTAEKSNFYPVLAETNTDAAVNELYAAYNAGEQAALASLTQINNYKAAPVLLEIARKHPELADQVLPRYVGLVEYHEPNVDVKRFALAGAMELAQSSQVKNKIINAISAIPTMKAFLLAGRYLDNEETAYAAAMAVKNIVATTKEEIDYAALKSNLEKAIKIFERAGSADDGYAVDQLKKVLVESEPSPKFELSAEEKAQGFEVLFDGTDLDKWQGDKEGYTPVNGAILVSANYGSTGNLYTKKEYRNFVFRFEFCFLKPAVNNGVGIRTPMGVDAAFDAMCEVQILDHDDPVYVGLNPYQVHGSVYGVVPAKRIVHKPLGEWSTEEIRVEGDHITVTVNGEVIVNANVRKACKGHNVAPDGSTYNPYIVDKRNHPGMFNKKGYVSFCGHGAGLKLRNVRILDLGDKQ